MDDDEILRELDWDVARVTFTDDGGIVIDHVNSARRVEMHAVPALDGTLRGDAFVASVALTADEIRALYLYGER